VTHSSGFLNLLNSSFMSTETFHSTALVATLSFSASSSVSNSTSDIPSMTASKPSTLSSLTIDLSPDIVHPERCHPVLISTAASHHSKFSESSLSLHNALSVSCSSSAHHLNLSSSAKLCLESTAFVSSSTASHISSSIGSKIASGSMAST